MLQIISDSSCDLPEDLIKKHNIHIVPLTVTIDGKEYRERIDLSARYFALKMATSPTLPKTSQPAPGAFAQIFKKLSLKGPMLCLTISSKLSGTYLSACTGKDLSKKDVVIFDTLAGSLGHGLQLLKAAELAALGLSREEILETLKRYREEMNILILLNTLENIVKGGRLNKFSGAVAKILDMRILLEGVNGAVQIVEKVRGKQRFMQKVLERVNQKQVNFSQRIFGITHVNNPEDAENIKYVLQEKYRPKNIIINDMGSTMATYAGKNGMIISF